MQTFQVIAPEGNLIIDTITGYPVGEATPEAYENAKFDVLELLSTLAGRMPLIPVPFSAMSYTNQGQEVAREMASIARYKEAIYEQPKPEPKAKTHPKGLEEIDDQETKELLQEFGMLIDRLGKSGFSLAGLMIRKTDSQEHGFAAPFLVMPTAEELSHSTSMASAIHQILHRDNSEKMALIATIFATGLQEYKECMGTKRPTNEKDS